MYNKENLFDLLDLDNFDERDFIQGCQDYLNNAFMPNDPMSSVSEETQELAKKFSISIPVEVNKAPIHVSMLDLAIVLGFASLKEMYTYVQSGSTTLQRVFDRVKSIIENNHVKNIIKDPKNYSLSITLLQNDHNWTLKPTTTTLNENVTTIKLDYDKNFKLVASQFEEQMNDVMIETLENSVKTLSASSKQPKLISPAKRIKAPTVEALTDSLKKDED